MPITTADIQTLEQHYRIDGPNVMDFIRLYPFLYLLLLEAIDPIRAQFPDEALVLEVDDFAENPAYHSLMLTIWTEREVEDASHRLDMIDETWWIPRIREARHRLGLHIRFSR